MVENDEEKEEKSHYTPEEVAPIDEQFAVHFKKNGGKFIYCENWNEVSQNFENILAENDWFEQNPLCFNPKLFRFLEENKLAESNSLSALFFMTTCENLIASDGSILFSSNQIKHLKPKELPVNIVVFATTSQFVSTKSDALTRINNLHKNNYPSNIIAINYFEETKDKNYMHYGSCYKNIYLLLLEDL